MLCKLLKYDFKSMLRTFVPLWALILIAAAIQTFLFNADIGASYYSTASVVFTITTLVLTALLVATAVLCAVLIIQRFYKGLLGDEGYLMFTLPVKAWELVASKLIVAMAIFLLSCLVAIGAWMIFMMIPLQDIVSAIVQEPAFAGLVLVTAIFCIAQHIARVYLAMAIGHLFYKHRIAISIIAYVALQSTYNQLSLLLTEPFFSAVSLTYSVTGALQNACPYALTAAIIELLISFFATQLILNKRLNLE